VLLSLSHPLLLSLSVLPPLSLSSQLALFFPSFANVKAPLDCYLKFLEPSDKFWQTGRGQILQGFLHGGALDVDGPAIVRLDHHAGEGKEVGVRKAA
jgi:hypothetical protein